MSTLNDEIRRRVNDGWVLNSQTDKTAAMSKRGGGKSCLLILILLMLGILPGIIYIIWPRRDQSVFLELTEAGTVQVSGRGGSASAASDKLMGLLVMAAVVVLLLAITSALD